MKRLFLLVALVATLVPAIFAVHVAGGLKNWQGLPVKGTTDSLYYYSRIKEVADGHPMIGNPYVYEYRNAFPPAFFLPDIISSIPVLVGIPFNIAVAINVFAWSFVFLILAFMLLRLLKMPKWWAFAWSVLMYVSSYSFILRPTIMQLVYPAFLAFLIALIKFLYEPHIRKRVIWLAAAAAATFYVYTFLAYIVLLTFVFIFLWFLFTKRFKDLRVLTMSGLFTAIFLIPLGIFTWLQIHSLYYLETLARIGLIYTHSPVAEATLYGRWIVIGLLALGLLWFFTRKTEETDHSREILWFSTGIAIFVGLFLNVLTGVELSLAIHLGRFLPLWMTMILAVGLYKWYFWYTKLPKTNRAKYIVVGLCLLMLTLGVVKNIPRGFDFFKFNSRGEKMADLEVYTAPLKWLDKSVPEQSVIWANESISEYITIMTRHYPLFFHAAVLHSISDQELAERYLLSRSRGVLTKEDIKKDFHLYSGELALKGDEYFDALAERLNVIKKNQKAFLREFQAKYLLLDRKHDILGGIDVSKSVYDDGRFVILPI